MASDYVQVPVPIQKLIYSTHSGRCAFCREFVFAPGTDWDDPANLGEIAHIVGERPGAARHDPGWAIGQINDPSNLMLMCRRHHRQVDRQQATYTVDKLRTMKARHEEWLEALIAASLESKRIERTVLLQSDQDDIDEVLALEALVPDYTTGPVHRIRLPAAGTDWAGSCGLQGASIDAIRGQGLPDSFAVFALSSIPTTANLGHVIGNRCSVRLHQFDRHRDGGVWLWPEEPSIEDDDMVPIVEELPDEVTERSGPVMLRISLSASVGITDCTQVLSDPVGRAHIRVANPSLDRLRSPGQLEAFGRVYRETLEKINALVPECTEIHVFAAVPCGAAFQIGRQWNRNMDRPLVLYQYSRAATPKYENVLTIPQEGDATCPVTST